jgi:predicted nucleic acid-binding protein
VKVIIDANIIFSALIKGSSIYLSLVKNLEVYAPDFIFLELEKYEDRILNKTSSKEKMRKITYEILKKYPRYS